MVTLIAEINQMSPTVNPMNVYLGLSNVQKVSYVFLKHRFATHISTVMLSVLKTKIVISVRTGIVQRAR